MARVAMLLTNPFTHDARVEREARALAALGHEVRVFCLPGEGLAAEEARGGFSVVRVPTPGWIRWTGPRRIVPLLRWWTRYRFLGEAAEGWRPEVVHGHDVETLVPAAELARRLRIPHVHDDHEVGLEKLLHQVPRELRGLRRVLSDLLASRIRREGERLHARLLPRAAAVLTVSPGCADVLARFGVRPAVVRNLPDGSDPPPDPRLRERAGLPADARVALCQGTMTEATAADLCVSAAGHLPPGWWMVFLGVTWMRGRLEEQARREGVADRVRFLDAVPPAELPGFTRAADVGLAPVRVLNESERRGLSNKLFEYLHAGLPVVTTAGTAQAEVVQREEAGVVLEANGPEAIAAAVRTLGGIPEAERRSRSLRLRGIARERYSWEREAEVLAGVYAGIRKGK